MAVEMNGTRSSKPRNLEKTFPRCLGRMVNLLDLNTSLAANRLLTEIPYHDGPALSMDRSDAATMSPIVDPIEDKEIVSELRRSSSNKKSNLTPMKMLIAQEMSKEVESKRNPPSLVAKLMGLDALPQQQPDSAVHRSHSRGYSQSHSDIPLDYWPQEDGLEVHMQREIPHCQSVNEYKDVYEIWQESEKGCYAKESPPKGRRSERINDRRMDLVCQRLTEAKRLSTDGKLRHSKQLHDAMEVLSTNKDFFLKFLQEPNSLFSQHLFADFQSVPPPPETKRITVLRPSKVVDNKKLSGPGKDEKLIKRASHVDQPIGWDKNGPGFPPPNLQVDDNPTPPTRIVVLKPSPGKPHDIKAMVSPPPLSPRVLHCQELYREREDNETRELEEAKGTTWPIRESLSGHRRDETLLSSVFSNDYIGDGSFSNISENEYAVGNNNEIEVASPTGRHSWDYINRFASPYSSSLSRPSYSPESSVSREAKKRLSERWAMMASARNFQEQRHARKSSSTLGEMLALSDTKNPVRSEEEDTNNEQEPRGSKPRSTSDLNKDENVDNSPRNLLRSKSLPVSSSVFGGRLNVEVPDPEVGKTDIKEVTKQRSGKSSLKGKVSSLFFSRNKSSSKKKSGASQSKAESKISAGMVVNTTEDNRDETSRCANDNEIEEGSLQILRRSSSKSSLPNVIGMGPKQATISPEARLSLIKPEVSGSPCENQDQPSPISILEPPFLEDDCFKSESYNINADKHGARLSAHSIKSNLIDKSPPIGSIARTLSWDNSCMETATSYQPKPTLVSQEPEVEEPEWLFYIQSLLSAAGLDGEVQSDSFFPRWHSPESLLDPSLRDKYTDLNDEEIIHEAKQGKMRSTRKLVFDCVNAALVDISGHGSETRPRSTPSQVFGGAPPTLVDQVWDRMKEWLPCEVRCFSGIDGDNHSLAAEMVVSKEILGKGWVEHRSLEIDNIGKEIEGRLVEELVHEAVFELTGRVC